MWGKNGQEERFITLLMGLYVCLVVSGLLKTHNLSFQDCECLQAVFDKDNCTNVLRAQPRSSFLPTSISLFLCLCFSVHLSVSSIMSPLSSVRRLWVDTVLHFPPSLEEVCVSVSSDRVWLRNHVEDDAGDV